MFLCRKCFDVRMDDGGRPGHPFLAESYGKCEDCQKPAWCADPPSSWLPVPSPAFRLSPPKKS